MDTEDTRFEAWWEANSIRLQIEGMTVDRAKMLCLEIWRAFAVRIADVVAAARVYNALEAGAEKDAAAVTLLAEVDEAIAADIM